MAPSDSELQQDSSAPPSAGASAPRGAFEAWVLARPVLVLGVLAALLYLPRLGSFGFWDPTEVRVADAARVLNDHNAPTTGIRFSLVTWLVARGFRLLGTGELGGRLPLALCSIFAVLALYYAARAILRPRGALLAAVALATMPSLLFGGRQLTSSAPLTLGVTLALAGLVRLAWPPAGASAAERVIAALVAAAGLALGTASGGLLVGALGPLLAVAVALAVTTTGRARALVLGVLSLGAAVPVVLAFRKHGAYSPLLLGGTRAPQMNTVITTMLRPLGFAAVPWLALAPFAVLRALDGTLSTSEAHEGERATFARALLPAWLVTTYLAATLHATIVTDLIVPAAPVLALLAGAYLDELLSDRALRPIEGVAVGVLAIVFGHDVLLTTDAFVSVQSLEQIRWPQPLFDAGVVLFAFAAAFGVCVAAALALPDVWVLSVPARRERIRQLAIAAALGVQVLFSLALVQWLIPAASKHLSPKDLYGKTRQLDPKAPLAQYRFNATGASYYMGGRTALPLGTLDDVLTFLKRPERVFIFVGSEELASMDQAARGGSHPTAATDGNAPPPPPMTQYFVVDDSNSRFLILSNQLGPKETDLNPLRRLVFAQPTSPQNKLLINFEDKLQLVGYDLPAEVSRGEDVKVRLHFKVLAPVGASYKVFLHFDGPGARVNGDHVPLDGKFPTQFWTAGTYVIDEYILKPDRSTQPSGAFQLFFGLFAGDHRMKVKEGPSDGENRVKVGNVRVK